MIFMIYLDNAATTGKKPISVINANQNALKLMSANPGRSGHTLSMKAADTVYSTRKKVSDFFNALGPERVVFTLNCTESLNFVIKGVLSRGEKCVVSDMEHNAVMRPLCALGADIRVATVEEDPNTTFENFKANIDGNTKLVICTAGSNVTGLKTPISQIGKYCREKGVLFAVDAAQGAGVIPIDMKNQCIDYLCVAAHKGLYAPMGIGILIANADIKKTLIEGGTGTSSESYEQPDMMPERFESGTVNVPAIAALSAGIDFVLGMGIEKIYKHEVLLINRIYKYLAEENIAAVYRGFADSSMYLPVLSFNIKGKTSTETAAYLNSKGIAVRAGLHCAPSAHKKLGTLDTGTVRISTSVFNSQSEIDKVISVLKAIKKQ